MIVLDVVEGVVKKKQMVGVKIVIDAMKWLLFCGRRIVEYVLVPLPK